jgi:hypothetical protein
MLYGTNYEHLHGSPFQISKKMNMLIEGLQYFVLHKILGAKSSVLIFIKSEETPEKNKFKTRG